MCWGLAQDSQDPNPLIRALAVRTMGCIRVDKITEYLCDPLQRCLKVMGGGLACLSAAVAQAKVHAATLLGQRSSNECCRPCR